MFPTLRVCFDGQLDPTRQYAVYLDIVPVDSKRYRYAYHRSSWVVAGKADPTPPSSGRLYCHPDSPYTGHQLTSRLNVISFEKLKLTNNVIDKTGHVSLMKTSVEMYN